MGGREGGMGGAVGEERELTNTIPPWAYSI